MGEYIKVATTGEFKDGTRKKVTAGVHEILVASIGGSYYAIDNHCPHMAGDLSAGTMEGTVITCPRHGSQFDVRDGKNLRWMKGAGLLAMMGKAIKSPRPATTYNVRVEGDTISVEV
jgi:3-phenylpropionate/trans-cinnamate dioxygenase ferredoxin subunit